MALVVLFLALRLPSLWSWSPTWDEPIYVGAGKHMLVEGDRRAAALRYHPPLAYHLTSLPLALLHTDMEPWDPQGPSTQVGLDVLYGSRVPWRGEGGEISPRTVLVLSRLPVLLLGLVGMLMIRKFGERLFDSRCGWIAAAAWAVHPDLVAHGVLATTDIVAAVAALFLAAAYVAHVDAAGDLASRSRGPLLRLGAAVGLALAAKHSLLFTVATVAVFAFVIRRARGARGDPVARTPVTNAVKVAVLGLLVLWGMYLFEVRPVAQSDARPRAVSQAIADRTGIDVETVDRVAETVPVPAATYVQSLADAVLVKGRARGGTPWKAYLDGEWSDDGFWSYFPRAVLVKWPVSILLLVAGGLAGWWVLRKDRADLPDLVLALFLVPCGAAIASRLNIGVRHLMPALPFALLLGAAALSRLWLARPRIARGTTAALVLLLAVEWVPNLSDPLAFANLPSGGPDRLHRRLSDSNLDWGQDLWALESWAGRNAVPELVCRLHLPPGLYERESERHPVLSRREVDQAALARTIRAEDQAGEVPTETLFAISESEMQRPRYAHLADVEPLHRVGRVRIYRLPQD